MKNLTSFSIQKLLSPRRALVAFLLVLTSAQSVLAQNPFAVHVPPVNVSGLSSYEGSYLTALYVNAYPGGLSISSQQLEVSRVDVSIANLKIASDSLVLPAQIISWEGVSKPNYLVLVIHQEPDFTWVNADSSQPIYPAGTKMTDNQLPLAASSAPITALINAANGGIAPFKFSSQ